MRADGTLLEEALEKAAGAARAEFIPCLSYEDGENATPKTKISMLSIKYCTASKRARTSIGDANIVLVVVVAVACVYCSGMFVFVPK